MKAAGAVSTRIWRLRGRAMAPPPRPYGSAHGYSQVRSGIWTLKIAEVRTYGRLSCLVCALPQNIMSLTWSMVHKCVWLILDCRRTACDYGIRLQPTASSDVLVVNRMHGDWSARFFTFYNVKRATFAHTPPLNWMPTGVMIEWTISMMRCRFEID